MFPSTHQLTVSAGCPREAGLRAVADVPVPPLGAGAAVHAGPAVALAGHLVARGADGTYKERRKAHGDVLDPLS